MAAYSHAGGGDETAVSAPADPGRAGIIADWLFTPADDGTIQIKDTSGGAITEVMALKAGLVWSLPRSSRPGGVFVAPKGKGIVVNANVALSGMIETMQL